MPLNDYKLGGTIIIKGARKAAKGLGRVFKMSKKVFKGLGRVAKMAGRTLRSAFGKLGRATMVLTGIGAAGIKIWADFTLQMAKVGTLLPNGARAMKDYGAAVRRMSITAGQSTEVVAEGLFQAISAGVDAAKATKFMNTATKASVGGFTEMNTAVDGLTNVLNAYGLDADQAMKISDDFFTANKFGKTTFQELAQNIGTVAPMASALGVEYRDLLAATVSITKAGVNTARTMTQISAILTSTMNASTKLSKGARKHLGLVFGPKAVKHYGGIVPFLEAVRTKTGGNIKILRKLFPNVRAMRGILRLTSKSGFGELVNAMEKFDQQAGITNQKFKEVSGTLGHQLKQVRQLFTEALRNIGEALVSGFGITLKGLVSRMRKGMPRFKAAAAKFFGGVKAGFSEALPEIQRVWVNAMRSMGDSGTGMLQAMGLGFRTGKRDARAWGRAVGKWVGHAITGLGKLVTKLTGVIDSIASAIRAAKLGIGFLTGRSPTGGKSLGASTAAAAGKGGATIDRGKMAGKILASRFSRAGSGDPLMQKVRGKAFAAAQAALATGKLSPSHIRALYASGAAPAGSKGSLTDQTISQRMLGTMRRMESNKGGAMTPARRKALAARDAWRKKDRGRQAMAHLKNMTPEQKRAMLSRVGGAFKSRGMSMLGGFGKAHQALGKVIADAVGNRPWNMLFKMENKTEVDTDASDWGGGGSGGVDHAERGAGDAVVEFRMKQKYLITEGKVQSVPLEFTSVRGSGGSVFAGGGA